MYQQNQSIIYPLPTDTILQEREVAWRVKLPDDYKEFIMRKNGFRPSKNLFSLGCSTNPVGEKSPTGFFTCKKEKSRL